MNSIIGVSPPLRSLSHLASSPESARVRYKWYNPPYTGDLIKIRIYSSPMKSNFWGKQSKASVMKPPVTGNLSLLLLCYCQKGFSLMLQVGGLRKQIHNVAGKKKWGRKRAQLFFKKVYMCVCVCIYVYNYSWFTMLCKFLLYIKVTHSYICIHYLSYIIFHHGLPKRLDVIPCAIQ